MQSELEITLISNASTADQTVVQRRALVPLEAIVIKLNSKYCCAYQEQSVFNVQQDEKIKVTYRE